jgi:predicted MPP superfamily phosphohydrolase
MVAALAMWGLLVEPYTFDEAQQDVQIPGLPAAWHGRRIAVIADLQVGAFGANVFTVRRIVRRIVRLQPAAVLIAGDFVYKPTEEHGDPAEAREEIDPDFGDEVQSQVELVGDLLAPLRDASIPAFAVLGNHDYAMQWPDSLPLRWVAARVAASLNHSGVRVLQNESVILPLGLRTSSVDPAARLYLVGIGPRYPRADRPLDALSAVPAEAARLVFMHNPASYREIPAGAAPLAVAAHTHGGQIRIPFTPGWTWLNWFVEPSLPAAAGWVKGYGRRGNRLYINRGIGFSYAPVRINASPELTVLTLHPS